MNRTLEAQLSKFVDDHQRDWDHYLPFLMLALRSATSEATKCSPAMLQFGRELRLPVDLLLSRPGESVPTHTYNEKLQQKLEQVHTFARESLRISSDYMKGYYDLRADGKTFQAGDAVWLYNPRRKPGLTPKLMRPWEGPYVVTKAINDLVYRVQLTPRGKPRVVHRNRLWEYSGLDPPTWFKPNSQEIPPPPPQLPTPTGGDLTDKPETTRRSGRQIRTPNRFQVS